MSFLKTYYKKTSTSQLEKLYSPINKKNGQVFSSPKVSSLNNNSKNTDNLSSILKNNKGMYFTINSFEEVDKRSRDYLADVFAVGVDIDCILTPKKIKKLLNTDLPQPTLFYESKTRYHWHMLFYFKKPVNVRSKDKYINKIKEIEKSIANKYNKKIEDLFNVEDPVDVKKANGPERWWRNPINNKNKHSYYSNSRIDFNKWVEKIDSKNTSTKDCTIKDREELQKYLGKPDEHLYHPLSSIENIPEHHRNNQIFYKSLLAFYCGFSIDRTKEEIDKWWNNRQENKKDFDKKEAYQAMRNAYNPKYITNDDNEYWKIDENILNYITKRKPISRRDYLHKEEIIDAIINYLDDRESNRFTVSNWAEFISEASEYIPGDKKIPESSFHKIKKYLNSINLLAYTCHANKYIAIRYYMESKRLLYNKTTNVNNIDDTVYIDFRVRGKNGIEIRRKYKILRSFENEWVDPDPKPPDWYTEHKKSSKVA